MVQKKGLMSSKNKQKTRVLHMVCYSFIQYSKPINRQQNLHIKSTVTSSLLSSLMLEQRRCHLSWLATPSSGLIVQLISQLGTSFTCNNRDQLGPVYTKRQRQCWDNSAMTLAILLSLKTMESLQNWGCNPFSSASIVFNENRIASVITELLQHWRWRLV